MLNYSEQIMTIMRILLQYFIPIQQQLSDENSEENSLEKETLKISMITYCKLLIHVNAFFDEIEKDAEAISELINWSNDVLLPLVKMYVYL